MPDGIKKRRAEEQLSPYSLDLVDIPETKPEPVSVDQPIIVKKARAKRNIGTKKNESLKGIFGNVSLSQSSQKSQESVKTDDVLAGLNKSFLKAIERVISKQSNKDLTYLFRQYEKFVADIKENSQE